MYISPKNATTNNLMLKVKINGTEVDAIIDTAAQVTLPNESFAKKLDPAVNLTNPVILNGAGENNNIPARTYSNKGGKNRNEVESNSCKDK